MSQLPFFTWHNILCDSRRCCQRGARRVYYACRFSLVLRHTEPSSVRVVAVHDNMHYARQHGVRSARLPRFGEMFQWRKSLVCCFGACGTVNYTRAPSITLAPPSPPSFALATPTDGSIKFCSFFFVKWFVKIDREVTSNIKFKKYKIVNKKVLIAYVLF